MKTYWIKNDSSHCYFTFEDKLYFTDAINPPMVADIVSRYKNTKFKSFLLKLGFKVRGFKIDNIVSFTDKTKVDLTSL